MLDKVIRDSVHGDIYINDEVVYEIINTPEMQRLRRILQLGGAQFAYPSASHTRSSHSLGVYHIVGMFLEGPGFSEVSKEDGLLVRLAGLMHDFGHGAFSHTFEKITTRSHELYTADIITNPEGNIAPILIKHGINPSDVVSVIDGTYPNKAINLLVSSQLDADRLDYLMRDSYNCGVNYANIDVKWLSRHAFVIDEKITFPKKTIYAIESYLLGRYHMYQQVYGHKLSVAFDEMFKVWYKRLSELNQKGYQFRNPVIQEMFSEIFAGETIPTSKYLKFDDYMMFEIFKSLSEEEDKIIADLSSRIVNRNLFAYREFDEVKVNTLKAELREQGFDTNYYLIKTTPKKPMIYKDGIIDGKDETIYIQKSGKIKPLSKVSLLSQVANETNGENLEKKYLFPKEIV
ncbi:HD domain-containing protein [[Acholeplasma] multilocale]|uniref:HD domain-containing protein n=1 Tax=[Acholeplasma] multilocale TaxID=264638 RepID=UPI00047D54F4|nr:HD domain-containing protein [[Acholeplasma] multilocale]